MWNFNLSLKVKAVDGGWNTGTKVLHMSKHKDRVILINSPKKETHKYPSNLLKHSEGLGKKGVKWSSKLIREKAVPSTHIPKWILPLHHGTTMDGQTTVIYLLEWNQRIQAEPAEHYPWKSYPIYSRERKEITRGQKGYCVCPPHQNTLLFQLNTFLGAGKVRSRYENQKSPSIFCSLICPTSTRLYK